LNNTEYELHILLKTNSAQVESQLKQNLNRSGDIVKNRLAVISDAISIHNLTQIVSNLHPIMIDRKQLSNNTTELKFLIPQLSVKSTECFDRVADCVVVPLFFSFTKDKAHQAGLGRVFYPLQECNLLRFGEKVPPPDGLLFHLVSHRQLASTF